MGRREILVLVALTLAPATALASARENRETSAALRIESGSLTRQMAIALSRDLVIEGDALGGAVALDGSAHVSGRVGGDLVVLDGDANLSGTAEIEGDVYVLGGEVVAAPGARIGGRTVAHPRAAASWLLLLEGPALGLPAFSRAVLGAKLALGAAWLLVSVALVAAFSRPLASTADEVREAPLRCFLIGIVAVLSMTLLVLLLSSFVPAIVGVPLVVLVILFALVLKLWGTVAVFQALGERVALASRRPSSTSVSRSPLRRGDPMTAILLGLVLLTALKLVPWAGLVAWTAATFLGAGAAFATKLGRREPWLEGR